MSLLTREAILATAGQVVTETVPVPEWGGDVLVKAMNGAERDRFEESLVAGDGKRNKGKPNVRNVRARLVAATVVDEKGSLMFTPGDVEQLGKTSAAALDRVFDAARRLSGMTERDVEELEENLDSARSEDSISD